MDGTCFKAGARSAQLEDLLDKGDKNVAALGATG
jgi:hypothetical protein